MNVMAVFGWVIHLADELEVRVLLAYLRRGVSPELGRHHLRHVTTESVNMLPCPEEQDVSHFLPRGGYRGTLRKVIRGRGDTGIVIHAVVKLHRLIPVVTTGLAVELVITRSLGRFLVIRLLCSVIEVEIRIKPFARAIVEVVLLREALRGVVTLAEILHALGFTDAVVLTGHMVGNKVNDHLHASLMDALHQLLKLTHALLDINGQVRINVIVIGNGIGRAGLTLHNGRMVGRNAVASVIGKRSMTNDSRQPKMTDAHLPYLLQHGGCQVVQLATTVFGNRTVLLPSGITIAEKTREYLIDNDLLHHSSY